MSLTTAARIIAQSHSEIYGRDWTPGAAVLDVYATVTLHEVQCWTNADAPARVRAAYRTVLAARPETVERLAERV